MKFYTALITVLALVTLAQCNVGDIVFDHFTDAAQYYLKLLNENCDEGGSSAQYQKLVEVSLGAFMKKQTRTNQKELYNALTSLSRFLQRDCKLPSERIPVITKWKIVFV